MSKANLGIVKASKGEDLRTKNAALQTHNLPTPARKADVANAAKRITTRDIKRTK
jgi:hypothetical protein